MNTITLMKEFKTNIYTVLFLAEFPLFNVLDKNMIKKYRCAIYNKCNLNNLCKK